MAAPPSSRIVAIYPGSFDPITNGHLDLISRGSKLADRLIVAVLQNQRKTSLFTVEERVEMLTEVVKPYPNVEVGCFHGLLVDYVATPRSEFYFARHSRHFGLRIRIADRAHEPASQPRRRDRVSDGGRSVLLRQLATGEGSGVAGRQRLRTGAAADRRAAQQPRREVRY